MAESFIIPLVRKKVLCKTVEAATRAALETAVNTALTDLYNHANRYDIFSIENAVSGSNFYAFIYYYQVSQDNDQIEDLPGFPTEE